MNQKHSFSRYWGFIICLLLMGIGAISLYLSSTTQAIPTNGTASSQDFIKWAEFNIPLNALQKAGQADIDRYQSETPVNWIEALACLATTYGGDWTKYKPKQLDDIIQQLNDGQTPEQIVSSNKKSYQYYYEVYQAVLGGFIGIYQLENPDGSITTQYGVKVFSPIASGYGYSHYRDFMNHRSYGFSRPHMGNDLLGNTGTPIIAVESGTVESLGWNQYGGWRIGIRSFDKKRYYYYAHLKSGHPFVEGLKEHDTVLAGEVIGYLGMTGYSTKEDTNGMSKPHLHFGMQLIFDESQKECDSEIWIDVYDIINFLEKHRSETIYDEQSNEHIRLYDFNDIDSVEP